MSLPITDFVDFTVETPGQALASYNVNVLGLLTKDAPLQNYASGATATATVGGGAVTGFIVVAGGTNFLTPPPVFLVGGGGKGALAIATVALGVVTGITVVNGGTGYTTAPTVVLGQGFQIYNSAIQVGADFGTNSETYQLAEAIFSQSPNITSAGGYLVIYAMSAADTLSSAITALSQTTYCGGYVFGAYQPSTSELIAASDLVQGLQPGSLLSDLYPAGMSYQISQLVNKQTRLLIHTASALQARLFAAGYAARLLSVNFYGTGTTLTMNLKQVNGVPVDTGINATVAAQCSTVGVDYYAQVGTLSEVVSTGGNDFSDNVYNLNWLVGALQVATFNVIGTTPTKVPQTESGMNTIKQAIVAVLQQAVANGFLAPGAWTGQTYFGDPVSWNRNIADFGFYVYSQPVSQQLAAQRVQRIAPLIQIAVKYAGAIQMVLGVLFPQN